MVLHKIIKIEHDRGKGMPAIPNFMRMLQGLVERLISVSISLTLLSSRLDFFFVILCPPGKSLTQMIMYPS